MLIMILNVTSSLCRVLIHHWWGHPSIIMTSNIVDNASWTWLYLSKATTLGRVDSRGTKKVYSDLICSFPNRISRKQKHQSVQISLMIPSHNRSGDQRRAKTRRMNSFLDYFCVNHFIILNTQAVATITLLRSKLVRIDSRFSDHRPCQHWRNGSSGSHLEDQDVDSFTV
jgi:hypothetical protein